MNAKFFVSVCVVLVLGAASAARSAPFANLDFEDAVVPGDVLPSWSVNNLGPVYDLFCLGSSCVSVHDVGSPAPLDGSFSVFLQGGTSGDAGALPLIGAAISQAGDVPGSAKSIRLLSTVGDVSTDPIISFENLRVSLGGANIPLVSLGTSGDLIILGGDVSAFAGTTAELTISTAVPETNGPELWAWVDTVSFSSVAVPEPGSWMLLSLAVCAIVIRARAGREPNSQ